MVTKRNALLVLGTHRSGTSVVAGCFVQLGAFGPKTLMPPDANNPTGYWESLALHDFHERLLVAAGTRWDAWTQVSPTWLDAAAANHAGLECRRLLEEEYADAALLVIKDPRICRLMPFWLPVLADAGIDSSAVLVFRNPYDVAASITDRNGLVRDEGLLLWMRHVLESEFHSRNIPRSLVRYEDLLANWRQVADDVERDLGISWPVTPVGAEPVISRFVDAGLQHHRAHGKPANLPQLLHRWLAHTQTAIAGLMAGDPREAAAATQLLDDVRAEFDDVTSLVNSIAEHLTAARGGLLESRVSARQLEDRLADFEKRLEANQRDRVALEAELGVLRQQRDELGRRFRDSETERIRMSGYIAALLDSRSWRLTAPLRAVAEILKLHRPA